MILLNEEQGQAVETKADVIVTACPGSGKTRVLTARVIRGIDELASRRERVIALTYTNRAADEIQVRLDEEGVELERLWAGTIHSFALEWILRPYAPYCEDLRYGFTVANEFVTEQLLQEIGNSYGITYRIRTTQDRDGDYLDSDPSAQAVFRAYKTELRTRKLIDYDDVLYLAFKLLKDTPEIASTLGSIIRVICVDEVQDIQDLQYGILSLIYRASAKKPALFLVGDEDQSIYESLGAMTKTPAEISEEFGLTDLRHLKLHGNYRSTQRIIDFYRSFRPLVPQIEGRSTWFASQGLITFENQTITTADLATAVAARVTAAMNEGVATNDICVIAPHWAHVKSLARQLVNLLPEVEFDAPGLSPLHSSRENFWFKIGRLVLTSPSPRRIRTRMRWAKEAISDLRILAEMQPPDNVSTPRRLLRLLNGLSSPETDGLEFLRDIFGQFLRLIDLDVETCVSLKDAYEAFFDKAQHHLADVEETFPRDIESFRRLFSHPSGVVVNTCHGVKGEEYDTVIVFAMLRGFIPNWDVIINGTQELVDDQESKLLYVICSRAKRRLHLIAESGRQTRRHNPYETSNMLRRSRFAFDFA